MSPRLLANGGASLARNTKLWTGAVEPFRAMQVLDNAMPHGEMVRSLFYLDGLWLAWTMDVDVVQGFTVSGLIDRIYYTGDGAPKVTTRARAEADVPTPANSVVLGIQPPQLAPGVGNVTGAGTGTALLRFYVYTWVTEWDEESVPSPPSAGIDVKDGQSVDVTGYIAAIDPNPSPLQPHINRVRFYRTEGGVYKFCGEELISSSSGTFTDSTIDLNLGENLQSQHYYPPDRRLKGLIGLANGSMAGFWDRTVAFSEPYQPHAWPPEYQKVFDYKVVGLGTFGNTTVVCTEGFTYTVTGSDPRNFAVARVPDPYPCISKRSIVSSEGGVIYAADDGLMFIGYGRTEILTRDVLTRDDWQRWKPRAMHGVIFEGRYYGFYESPRYAHLTDVLTPNGGGFIFDFNDRYIDGVMDSGVINKSDKLIELDFYASATFANPQVVLHLVTNEDIYSNTLKKWEAGTGYIDYLWRSKQFSFPYEVQFAAAKVTLDRNGPVHCVFGLRDGASGQLLFSRLVGSSVPFRLPGLLSRTEWIVEVSGTSFVQEVHIATSLTELNEGSA